MRLLVFGGRKYSNKKAVFDALDRVHNERGPIVLIIHEGATGADSLAAEWARLNKVEQDIYKLTKHVWHVIGDAAGPLRNKQMVKKGRPDVAVGFPGDTGTLSTARILRNHKPRPIPCWWPCGGNPFAKEG